MENSKKERIEKVKKALSISIAGAEIPTDGTMKKVKQYIEGEEKLVDIQNKIIREYDENGR